MNTKGWVIKEYVRRLVNISSHIPEELMAFEEYFERCGDYLVIYIPRVIYMGENEELRGKTERLLPDFLTPYCHYPVEDKQSTLDPDVETPQTTADERTITHWKRTLKEIINELKRKARELERIGIKINKLPDGIEAATRELITRLGDRWFSKCYVMAFLGKNSRRTNLEHPPSFSLRVLFCEIPSIHGGKTDAKSEQQT